MLSLRYSSKQLGAKQAERESLLQKYGLFIKLSGAALFLIVFGIVGFFVLSSSMTQDPIPNSTSNSTNDAAGRSEPFLAPVVPDQAHVSSVSSQNSQPMASPSNQENSTSVVTEDKPSVNNLSHVAVFLQKHKTIIIAVSVVTAVLLLVGIAIAVILYKRHYDELAALEQRMLEEEAAALAEQLRLEEERRHAWSIWSIIKRYGPGYFILSTVFSFLFFVRLKLNPNIGFRDSILIAAVVMFSLSGVQAFVLFLVYWTLVQFEHKPPKSMMERVGKVFAQILFLPFYILSLPALIVGSLVTRDWKFPLEVAKPFFSSFSGPKFDLAD